MRTSLMRDAYIAPGSKSFSYVQLGDGKQIRV